MPYTPEQQQLFQPYQIGANGLQPIDKRSGIGKFFLGSQEQFNRTPTQTPQGMELLNFLMSGAQQGLANPEAGFEPIGRDVTRQFNTETIPGIAERFTSAGGQRSSAFQGALGSAGAGLAERLAAMKANYGLENRRGLLDQARLGLTPQFETQYRPAQSGFLENLLSMLTGGLSSAGQAFGQQYGRQLGQFAGEKSFGPQGGDVKSLITKLLPLLV